MMLRCPKCTYVGVGHLAQYRCIINDRGYANIVSSTKPEDEVYGHVYNLTSSPMKTDLTVTRASHLLILKK